MSRAPTPEYLALIAKVEGHVHLDGDCWIWAGALQTCGSVPTMRHNGKTGPVRRFILLEKGVNLAGMRATCRCGNPLCVHPAHLVAMTASDLQKRTAKTLGYHGNLSRRRKLAENARTRAKITAEIAEQIRCAPGTQREIAERFGVSQSVVSRVMLGKGWLTYSSAVNPFAGLMV